MYAIRIPKNYHLSDLLILKSDSPLKEREGSSTTKAQRRPENDIHGYQLPIKTGTDVDNTKMYELSRKVHFQDGSNSVRKDGCIFS